jgi:hypothetical protein
MVPSLHPGERITLTGRRPRFGDIVLARQARGLVLHRLVWGPPFAVRGAWRTQADRGQIWDGRVAPEQVLATVVQGGGAWRRLRLAGLALRSLAIGLATRGREILAR